MARGWADATSTDDTAEGDAADDDVATDDAGEDAATSDCDTAVFRHGRWHVEGTGGTPADLTGLEVSTVGG